MKIGVVGLGKMGSAFAHRLLGRGHPVCVWNRSAQPLAELASAGAVPYTSLPTMLANVDVVIVMLWGDEAAREVTLGTIIPAVHRPQVVIESSTLSPQMYEAIERAAQQQGVEFVAAPVLGNPDAVRDGTLTILAGGTEQTVERVRPILTSLGHVIQMKSARASAYLKLANNTILGVVAETLGELLELCDRADIDRRIAVDSLTGAFERAVGSKRQQLLDSDSEPRFTLNALLKDLHLARDVAQSTHESMPILDAVVPQAESEVQHGLGDRDYIVLALDRGKA